MANDEQIKVFVDNSRVCFTCINREMCYAANELRTYCEYYTPIQKMDEVEE